MGEGDSVTFLRRRASRSARASKNSGGVWVAVRWPRPEGWPGPLVGSVGSRSGVYLAEVVDGVGEYLDDDRPIGVGGDVADGALVAVGDQPDAG